MVVPLIMRSVNKLYSEESGISGKKIMTLKYGNKPYRLPTSVLIDAGPGSQPGRL
jgi:hypothetical protein